MKNLVSFFLFLTLSNSIWGMTFQEAVQVLKKHSSVQALESESKSLKNEARERGSWGDPMLKIMAKNYPKDSLANDKSPMTGLEFGISQKIALTTKYGHIKEAYEKMGQSLYLASKDKENELLSKFWNIIIEIKKIEENLHIYKENLVWIQRMLKVSKRLYMNGKISQQALFEIQIRKSEIETEISNQQFEKKEKKESLAYLIGDSEKMDLKTVPWGLLEKKGSENSTRDYKKEALIDQLNSKNHLLKAQKLSYIPDLTFSLGYTQRANIDGQGDFVSASLSFPIPVSSTRYASHSKAISTKNQWEQKLHNFNKSKESQKNQLILQIVKLKKEIEILTKKTLFYAENSRKVTSKSYSLGRSSYLELLQSEIKLQILKVKKTQLLTQLLKTQVKYKFIMGESLHE